MMRQLCFLVLLLLPVFWCPSECKTMRDLMDEKLNRAIQFRANRPLLHDDDDGYKNCASFGTSIDPVLNIQKTGRTFSIANCAAACIAYPNFGLRKGSECYCGHFLSSSSSAVGESECNTPCTKKSFDDKTKNCGGQSAVSLYRTRDYLLYQHRATGLDLIYNYDHINLVRSIYN